VILIHMYFRLDQLGKNVLRDVFVLVGAVETEVEVPKILQCNRGTRGSGRQRSRA
jgi:hypothetical protein